jgi:hypothetical protein
MIKYLSHTHLLRRISILGCTLFIFLVLVMEYPPQCSKPDNIYVDKNNTSGPWDGTQEHPYQTIQDGLDAAREGEDDVVLVKSGQYSENVRMKRGTRLGVWGDGVSPRISGPDDSDDSPTILFNGDNRIEGFRIDARRTGVLLDLGTALVNLERTHNYIRNCLIRGSGTGIYVTTPTNLTFGDGFRKSAYLHIIHNYFSKLDENGIDFNLTGPTSGELQISLDIKDNVIEGTSFTGIVLRAKGQGPNQDGIVRASCAGFISNNLIFGGINGLILVSENLGDASPFIMNNTIANNIDHGIIAEALAGPDGEGSTHPTLRRNIIAGNRGYGYFEWTKRTSADDLSYNLFYQNGKGHYSDADADIVCVSQTDLNTPIVDGKVVFRGGSGNLVANPLFVEGAFHFHGIVSFDGPHAFFLSQIDDELSPAVDAALLSAKDAGVFNRSTRTDFVLDSGIADLGFHYWPLE